MAIQIASNIQRYKPESIVIYFDTENAVTEKRLQQLGIDPNRLVFVSGVVTVENIFRIIDKFIDHKIKEGLEDVPFIVLWDSLAFTPSERALAGQEIQNTDGMIRAKVIAEYLPRYAGLFKQYNFVFLTVNQLRERMNLMTPYQSPTITLKGMNYSLPGGSSIVYASFHLLLMTKIVEILNFESYGFHGFVVECQFVKNKLARPLKPFYLVLDMDRGFQNLWTFWYYMKQLKLATSAAWCSIPGYEKKFRIKELENLYQTDPKFKEAFDKVAEQVVQVLKHDVENG